MVNQDNKDTLFTKEEIIGMLSGKDTLWKSDGKKISGIHVVFDNVHSANSRYMTQLLPKGTALGKNCFAVHSNPEVINYVTTHKNAIGIVSVNWISDKKDSLCRRFLNQVKVVGVKDDGAETYFKPYQAYIKTKEYAFCRDVYMINRQTRAGLGMGFVSFVAGNIGQRIILKMGIVPAIAPTRMVEMH